MRISKQRIDALEAKLKKVKYEIVWQVIWAMMMLGATGHVLLVTWVYYAFDIQPSAKDVWLLVLCVLANQVLQVFKTEPKPFVMPTNAEIESEYKKFLHDVLNKEKPDETILGLGIAAGMWMRDYIIKKNQ